MTHDSTLALCSHPAHAEKTDTCAQAYCTVHRRLTPDRFSLLRQPGARKDKPYPYKAHVLLQHLVGHYCPSCLLAGERRVLLRYREMVYEDALVTSIAYFVETLGMSAKQAREALAMLQTAGLIARNDENIKIGLSRTSSRVILVALTDESVRRLR